MKKNCFDFKVYSLKVRKYSFDAIVSRSESRFPAGIMDTEEDGMARASIGKPCTVISSEIMQTQQLPIM